MDFWSTPWVEVEPSLQNHSPYDDNPKLWKINVVHCQMRAKKLIKQKVVAFILFVCLFLNCRPYWYLFSYIDFLVVVAVPCLCDIFRSGKMWVPTAWYSMTMILGFRLYVVGFFKRILSLHCGLLVFLLLHEKVLEVFSGKSGAFPVMVFKNPPLGKEGLKIGNSFLRNPM